MFHTSGQCSVLLHDVIVSAWVHCAPQCVRNDRIADTSLSIAMATSPPGMDNVSKEIYWFVFHRERGMGDHMFMPTCNKQLTVWHLHTHTHTTSHGHGCQNTINYGKHTFISPVSTVSQTNHLYLLNGTNSLTNEGKLSPQPKHKGVFHFGKVWSHTSWWRVQPTTISDTGFDKCWQMCLNCQP